MADITYNTRVAQSEISTSSRNAAMAHFMKSFGNLHNKVGEVLHAHCHHCAIEMSCVELARAVGFLANHGVNPWNGETVVDPSSAKRLSALMLTCGTYDAAGDFAYRVGLPAKSGVGGGIVAILPGECGICVVARAGGKRQQPRRFAGAGDVHLTDQAVDLLDTCPSFALALRYWQTRTCRWRVLSLSCRASGCPVAGSPFQPTRFRSSLMLHETHSAAQDEVNALVPEIKLNRRGFMVTSLGAGFAASVLPVAAQTITTSADGLVAGEVKVPTKDGDMVAYRAMPATAPVSR